MRKTKLITIVQSNILNNNGIQSDSNNTLHLIKLDETDKLKIIIKNSNNKIIYGLKLNDEEFYFSSGVINNNECTINIE